MSLSVPDDARLEIKFVSYASQDATLLNWIKRHPANFYAPFPNRQVNNIYFDGYQYNAYTENLSGASARTKVRYRWYGASVEPRAGTLEIKQKRNYFGWKLHYPVKDAPYRRDMSWNAFRGNIKRQISEHGRLWLDFNPFPILLNRYHRMYFVCANQKIRITVDTKQAVWDQRFQSRPNFHRRANLPDTLVVEVKFDRNDREHASRIVQGLPLRVSRHSKYMIGVNTIAGN